MYVTVSLKIEIDARARLSDMESQIQQAGREVMKEGLKQALRQIEEQEKTCPHCGSERVQTQGTKRRVLLTSFGRVEVPLRRLRCQQCGHVFRPAEHCLAEIKGHNVTADLRELAALVGSSWPYEMAASVLKRLSGVQLSDERLRQLTNEQGSILAKQQQAQAQQVLQEAVSMSQIRAQREASGHMPKQKQPEMLQVGLGGRMAALARAKRRHGRENRGGRQSGGHGGQTGAAPAHQAALCGYLWASRRTRDAYLCSRL
jgi:hypothetical protein